MPATNIFDGQSPLTEAEIGLLCEVAAFLKVAPESLRELIEIQTPDELTVLLTPFAMALELDVHDVVSALRSCVSLPAVAPLMDDDVN